MAQILAILKLVKSSKWTCLHTVNTMFFLYVFNKIFLFKMFFNIVVLLSMIHIVDRVCHLLHSGRHHFEWQVP